MKPQKHLESEGEAKLQFKINNIAVNTLARYVYVVTCPTGQQTGFRKVLSNFVSLNTARCVKLNN